MYSSAHSSSHSNKDLLMTSARKQKVVAEFLAAEGCSANEIESKLRNVYGKNTIDVGRCLNEYKKGKTSFAFEPI